MSTIGKAVPCVALAAVFLLGGSAHAASPAQKCHEAKVKAQRKLESCLKKSAAEVSRGKPDRSEVCRAKYNVALSKKEVGPACHFEDEERHEHRAHVGDTD
jgi:hypothetical protein